MHKEKGETEVMQFIVRFAEQCNRTRKHRRILQKLKGGELLASESVTAGQKTHEEKEKSKQKVLKTRLFSVERNGEEYIVEIVTLQKDAGFETITETEDREKKGNNQ